jgi:NADH oxidase (H2O2-forming)
MKVVIIGNGIAGFSAAAAARRLSAEPEITITSAERESLYSPCVLPEYISGRIHRENTYVKGIGDYERLGIKTLFGRKAEKVEVSPGRVWLDSGESVSFDRLIVAAGSSAIEIGDRKRGSFVVKSLADADALIRHEGRKAVVVGSGAIGIEVAAAVRMRGYEVEVLEGLPRVLPQGMDGKAAERVKKTLEGNGIKVTVNEKADAVIGADQVEGLKTSRRELECDTVVWAIGMRPNVALAQEGGIEIGIKGGIKVNAHMETNIDGIYACGDCTEAMDLMTGKPALNLFWHNATRQGAVAGSNSVGWNSAYAGSENLMNFSVFGEHVVGFGRTVSALKEDGVQPERISMIEAEKEKSYYRLIFLDRKCLGAQFINPPKEIGLIWNLIRKGSRMDAVLHSIRHEEALSSKSWVRRVSSFFFGENLVEGE